MTREEAIEILSRPKSMKNVPDEILTAHTMAIQALEGTKWIPCSERPPEEIGTYMTTIDCGGAGLAVGQRFYCGKYLGWEDECVIAWMPLPDPWEGEEK